MKSHTQADGIELELIVCYVSWRLSDFLVGIRFPFWADALVVLGGEKHKGLIGG